MEMQLTVCSKCGKNVKIPRIRREPYNMTAYAIITGCPSCGHWYPDPTVRVTEFETREELDEALKNKNYNTEPRKE